MKVEGLQELADNNPDYNLNQRDNKPRICDLPEDLELFRDEVDQFCQSHLPAWLVDKVNGNVHLAKADHLEWYKTLASNGWLTGHWPPEFGGLGWSPFQRSVFESEVYRQGSPWLIPFGISFVGPVIYTFGSQAQKEKYLPGIRSADTWWCQGYSEAGAGSDLANIATRGARQGSKLVISGHKLWTTFAHWSDMMFALVKTEQGRKPQESMSFALIDLSLPGVKVNPIITIDGTHEVNEVVLDDVIISENDIVGEPGRGWSYAKFLLSNERLLGADTGSAERRYRLLSELLSRHHVSGTALDRDIGVRRNVARIEVNRLALESLSRKLLGEPNGLGDTRSSILKLIYSELHQELDRAFVDLIGASRLPFGGALRQKGIPSDRIIESPISGELRQYLFGRAATIYGGSSEIQKNIISKAQLGL